MLGARAGERSPGRLRLRPPARRQTRAPRRRHQAVPLSRSRPAPQLGDVDVGPVGRSRHRHAPEHRLLVPARAFLLGVRSARSAHVGDTAALDGHRCLRGRNRRPLPRADPRRTRPRPAARRPCLRSQPLLPPVHRADLGDPPPLVRPRLARRGSRRLPCAGLGGATPRCSRWWWRSSGQPTPPR